MPQIPGCVPQDLSRIESKLGLHIDKTIS